MGNQQYNASMLLYHGKVFFLIIILHPAAELLERHAQHLHLFQHIVADIMVELALYLHQFGFRLLRKGIAKRCGERLSSDNARRGASGSTARQTMHKAPGKAEVPQATCPHKSTNRQFLISLRQL